MGFGLSLASLPVLSSAVALAGDVMQYEGQRDTNAANRDIANTQMQFQERMSSTAYQRATADMKAAGLNPMLAYSQGGASSPAGATATMGNPAAGFGREFSESVSAASVLATQDKQRELVDAQVEKTKAETGETVARTPTYAVNMAAVRAQTQRTVAEVGKVLAETKYAEQAASTSAASAAEMRQKVFNLQAQMPQIEAVVEQLRAAARLADAQRVQAGATTRLVTEQERETAQRIKANLPAVEAALTQLQTKHKQLELPKAGMDAAVNDSYIGAFGAVLRALNPLQGLFK